MCRSTIYGVLIGNGTGSHYTRMLGLYSGIYFKTCMNYGQGETAAPDACTTYWGV